MLLPAIVGETQNSLWNATMVRRRRARRAFTPRAGRSSWGRRKVRRTWGAVRFSRVVPALFGLYAQTLENSVKVDFRLPQSGAALVCWYRCCDSNWTKNNAKLIRNRVASVGGDPCGGILLLRWSDISRRKSTSLL